MSSISLGALSDRLVAAGVSAFDIHPWHTGGGTLTLYLGDPNTPGGAIAVGPGTALDPFGSDGHFTTADLYVGDSGDLVDGDMVDEVPEWATLDDLVVLIVDHCRRIGVVK